MPRKKILLVDDSSTILMMEKFILRNDPFVIVTASNGEEAVLKADQERPDLILLDVVMPRMSGFEACRLIRENAALQEIPIIMVTTRGESANVETAWISGCTDYITNRSTPVNCCPRSAATWPEATWPDHVPKHEPPAGGARRTTSPENPRRNGFVLNQEGCDKGRTPAIAINRTNLVVEVHTGGVEQPQPARRRPLRRLTWRAARRSSICSIAPRRDGTYLGRAIATAPARAVQPMRAGAEYR